MKETISTKKPDIEDQLRASTTRRLVDVALDDVFTLRPGEHSRSLDDAERYQAIQELVDLGVLQPLSDEKLFHGRSSPAELRGSWRVRTDFSNAGDDTGNRNANKIPVLYTGSFEVARDYAKARALRSQDQPEVYEISSTNDDAMVFLMSAVRTKGSNSPDDRRRKIAAIEKLLPIGAEGVIDWRERAELPVIKERFAEIATKHRSSFLIPPEAYEGEGDTLKTLLRRYNSRVMFMSGNAEFMMWNLLQNKELIDVNDGQYEIDRQYIAQFAKNANIVGVEEGAISGTLGNKTISITSIIDLYSVNPKVVIEDDRRKKRQIFDRASQIFGKGIDQLSNVELRNVLLDPSSTPKQLVEVASRVDGGKYGQLYRMDAGNWEGYTLGEHTETVLRNFEENFAQEMPVGVLAAFRLVMLVHDLGKPMATADGEKVQQARYNKYFADQFIQDIGMDYRLGSFLVTMATDGLAAMSKYKLSGSDESLNNLISFLKSQENILGANNIISPYAYDIMLERIFESDSGAYTSMARTRRDGVYYRNPGQFDGSFKHPKSDLAGDRLLWRDRRP